MATDKDPAGRYYDGFYLRVTMKVFINPAVASLPEHAHLFPEQGCFEGRDEKTGEILHRECLKEKLETPLAESMKPLQITPEMDEAWNDWIKARVDIK